MGEPMKKVLDLLSDKALVRVHETDTVLAAARTMVEAGVGSLLVLDADERLLGIFTERDVMVRVVAQGKDPSATPIADVMTRDVYTTSPDREIGEVRREMRERHIRHVPVLDGERVLAVLGMRDLVRAALEEKRDKVSEMTAYIRGEGAPGN